MKKQYIVIFVILLNIIGYNVVKADNLNYLNAHSTEINLGGGYPIFEGLGSLSTIGDTKFIQFIPAICLNIDKRIKSHYTIGIGFAWANVIEEPAHGYTDPETWTITNIAFRWADYFAIKKKM